MFTLLQAARFFAAFLVVLHHGSGLFSQPDYFSYLALGGIFRAGDMGVDFFFVLSGFIILHAHWNDIGHPERILPYLKKRALRIYPAYLVVFCTVLVLAFLVDNQPGKRLAVDPLAVPLELGREVAHVLHVRRDLLRRPLVHRHVVNRSRSATVVLEQQILGHRVSPRC